MKPLLLLLVGGVAFAQPFSAGIKAGLPLTDFLNEAQGISTTVNNRYLLGPEVELRLPFGLGIEFDALYRHFSYTNIVGSAGNAITSIGSSGNWEFPLVAKYRFPSKIVRPYVEAGIAWDSLAGLKNTVSSQLCTTANVCNTVLLGPPVAQSQTTLGVVLGGGLDIHLFVIHVAPELRFTRWADQYFNLSGAITSRQNQAEFLVGFTF